MILADSGQFGHVIWGFRRVQSRMASAFSIFGRITCPGLSATISLEVLGVPSQENPFFCRMPR